MPGRTTHKYPHGKPIALVLVDIALLGVGALWLMFSRAWLPAVGIVALFIAVNIARSKIVDFYERDGLAVPIPRRIERVSFQRELPAPIRFLRYLAVAGVVALLFLGYAPMSELNAREGVIGSVIALFLMSGVYIVVGWYYDGKEQPRNG